MVKHSSDSEYSSGEDYSSGDDDYDKDDDDERSESDQSYTSSYVSSRSSYTKSNVDLPPPIVVDPGSGVTKAGFGNEDAPSHVFQTIVGIPRCFDEKSTLETREKLKKIKRTLGDGNEVKVKDDFKYVVGESATENRGELTLHYPIEHGNVMDWHEMEYIYEHIFYDCLDVETEDALLLISEPNWFVKKQREEHVETLFEMFEVYGMQLVKQASLQLYASGRTSGIVFDSGDQISSVLCIQDGYEVVNSQEKIRLGGRNVTEFLKRILTSRDIWFQTSAEFEICRELKEEMCYISMDYESDFEGEEKDFIKSYTLPDGNKVEIGKELFQATELMFKPLLNGFDFPSVHELILKSLNVCSYDTRKILFDNVIVTGGNTMINGFEKRLKQELDKQSKSYKEFKVHADGFRQFTAWIGGSVMASLPTFENQCITISDYDEYGIDIIHKK